MANASIPLAESDIVSVELERGGRRFPESWGAPNKRTKSRVRQLSEQPQETRLPTLLEENLWDRLAWTSLAKDENDRQPLVEAYIQSLNQIDEFRRDVEKVVRLACLANLEFHQAAGSTNVGARDAALSAKLDEMLSAAGANSLPPKNVLNAELVSHPTPIIRERLQTALANSLAEFTKRFFDLLARLVDRQLFGLIEWLPNHCCSYHFFKRVVIQENEGSRQVVQETIFDEPTPFDPESLQRVVGKRTTVDIRGEGKHYHRLARHEHAVMKAIRTTIKDSRVVMPPPVQELVEQIPEWLYPFIEVIDGDIFRERIIERDTKVETWEDAIIHDEPIYGCEPAVIIGPYVLTGWGPREVQAEQNRRQTIQQADKLEQRTAITQRRAPLFAAAAATLSVVALVTLVTALRGQGGAVFAALATVAALAATWQAAFDFLTARRNTTAAVAAHWITASIACQLFLAEWLIVRWFWPMSWITPVVLGLAAISCHAIGRQFR